MSKPRIGWIGLGKMGIPMSGQLVKAGYAVTVYNRTKVKESVSSPTALLQQCDVIFIMVTDDQAIRDVFTGKDGLLADGGPGGKLFINMSTVSPDIAREMAALCRAQGHDYLDAPVSGSVKQAEEGTLVIMVGGDPKAFERAKPVLDTIGRLTMRVGDSGSGNMAKLVINTLLAMYAQGLAEAVRFAERNGVATEDLMTLVSNSALGSPFIKIKGEAILRENFRAAFALKHIAKDLRLANDKGLTTPMTQLAFQTFQAAEPALGEEDIISIIKTFS